MVTEGTSEACGSVLGWMEAVLPRSEQTVTTAKAEVACPESAVASAASVGRIAVVLV